MKEREMLLIRLQNQQLSHHSFENVSELVFWMGAIQAQDYAMSKWAIASRLKKGTDDQVEEAINSGTILRTHILRPTWHFVSAADIRWMLEISAPHILNQMAYYDRQLEIDQKEIMRSIKLIEKTLAGNKQFTRQELGVIFTRAKFNCEGMRLGHLLMHAELRGIICSGARKGKRDTYALLGERVAATGKISRQESLAMLARKYFQSHGLAMLSDFIWWSGLPAKDAKEAVALLDKNISVIKTRDEDYLYMGHDSKIKTARGIYLLPNYDEYTVGYGNRAMIMSDDARCKISRGGNPLFSNVVVVNGKIAGTWKREIKSKSINISFELYDDFSPAMQKQLLAAKKSYEQFLGYGK